MPLVCPPSSIATCRRPATTSATDDDDEDDDDEEEWTDDKETTDGKTSEEGDNGGCSGSNDCCAMTPPPGAVRSCASVPAGKACHMRPMPSVEPVTRAPPCGLKHTHVTFTEEEEGAAAGAATYLELC